MLQFRLIALFGISITALAISATSPLAQATSKKRGGSVQASKKPTAYKYTLTLDGKVYNLTSDKEFPYKKLGAALVAHDQLPLVEARLEIASGKLVSLEASNEALEGQLEDLKEELRTANDDLEESQNELQEAKSEAEDAQSAFGTVESSYDRLKRAVRDLSYEPTREEANEVDRRSRSLGLDIFSLGLQMDDLKTTSLRASISFIPEYRH